MNIFPNTIQKCKNYWKLEGIQLSILQTHPWYDDNIWLTHLIYLSQIPKGNNLKKYMMPLKATPNAYDKKELLKKSSLFSDVCKLPRPHHKLE